MGRDFTRAVILPFDLQGKFAWIQMDFGLPRTIQSMSLALQRKQGMELLTDPSRVYAELQKQPGRQPIPNYRDRSRNFRLQVTITFSPTTARYFRLILPRPSLCPQSLPP